MTKPIRPKGPQADNLIKIETYESPTDGYVYKSPEGTFYALLEKKSEKIVDNTTRFSLYGQPVSVYAGMLKKYQTIELLPDELPASNRS